MAVPVAAGAAPAAGADGTVISHVTIDKNDPSVGYVKARYSCEPSANAPHLWVSVKQTADGRPDPGLTQEGSGFGHVAATWVQSHPTDLRCDGKNHVQDFRVDTTEAGYGQLVRGAAYVQFCLFSGNGAYAADQNFQQVK